MDKLVEIREEIDKIDEELLVLFEKRMDLVKEVIDYKRENNLPILNKHREDAVIKEKLELLQNKELKSEVKRFFTDLMTVSKEYQSRLK